MSQERKTTRLRGTSFVIDLFIHICQLSWNTSEYGGVDSVVIQPRNLWIPDILLYNRFSKQYGTSKYVFNYMFGESCYEYFISRMKCDSAQTQLIMRISASHKFPINPIVQPPSPAHTRRGRCGKIMKLSVNIGAPTTYPGSPGVFVRPTMTSNYSQALSEDALTRY